MRHENKFKVGDRVLCIDDGDTDVVIRGKEYDVLGVNDPYIDVLEDGKPRGMYARRFELIPSLTIEPGKHYRTRSGKPTGRVTVGDTGFEAVVDGRVRIFDKAGGHVHGDDDIVEAWVPKVGERVRRFKGHNPGSLVGHEAVVQAIEDISPDPEGPWLKFEDGTSGYAASFEPLPVATQPAAPTLKIEAGRYYKTRDGRKVGPMVRAENWLAGFYDSARLITGQRWEGDGSFIEGQISNLDLIAEWQETTNVGAQVDTLAEGYGSARVAAASNDNAAKPKFKVGDRVRLVVDDGNSAKVGATGVVGPREEFDMFVDIIWDENELRNRQMNGGYFKSSFEHLTTPTTTAIVAPIENGLPKPAAVPHIHASESAATTEAKRLAGIHKGKQFGVFVLATTAEEAAPTYQHEWQRLAKAGKKGDATKLLRNLSGLSLSSSQLAVEDWLKKAA